ncbi:flagellar hook assembly protein FlgD [Buchnera aphidicola]|uniref:flagellar hook assembly protein FlgD n=1 Tax=Buchnera aphidicola TaxID=9 RepID=UPI0034645038
MNYFINSNHNVNPPEYNTGVNNNIYSLDLQKNFLRLLIAQIKNQDPIDPMKNTELTSQLAQINTVSQMAKLNQTVTELNNQNKQNQNIQASSLIGHHVLIPSTKLIHQKNIVTTFGIELLGPAKLVNIQIKDHEGNIVFDKNIQDMQSGLYHLLWDGKNLNHDDVDTGQYTLDVTAKNYYNNNININTFSDSLVKSIITSSPNTANNILVNLDRAGTTNFSNIHEIFA